MADVIVPNGDPQDTKVVQLKVGVVQRYNHATDPAELVCRLRKQHTRFTDREHATFVGFRILGLKFGFLHPSPVSLLSSPYSPGGVVGFNYDWQVQQLGLHHRSKSTTTPRKHKNVYCEGRICS
jgi:hypothetical protein